MMGISPVLATLLEETIFLVLLMQIIMICVSKKSVSLLFKKNS